MLPIFVGEFFISVGRNDVSLPMLQFFEPIFEEGLCFFFGITLYFQNDGFFFRPKHVYVDIEFRYTFWTCDLLIIAWKLGIVFWNSKPTEVVIFTTLDSYWLVNDVDILVFNLFISHFIIFPGISVRLLVFFCLLS